MAIAVGTIGIEKGKAKAKPTKASRISIVLGGCGFPVEGSRIRETDIGDWNAIIAVGYREGYDPARLRRYILPRHHSKHWHL